MRRVLLGILGLVLVAASASAQTADEIISKYVKTIGGMDKLQAIKSTRLVGQFHGGGGFEAAVTEEHRRPNMVREEFSLQGLTGVNAYDGQSGWKIEPWNGKKDPEPLGEEEMKSILEDADFDGPLIDYQAKGNKVEYVGMDQFEGTDTYKLKVTQKNGDERYYFMDTDSYVPIKIEIKRFVRGAPQEYEISLGDYKQVAGVYMPFSIESGPKGSQNRSKVTWEKIEANVTLGDNRFIKPVPGATTPRQPQGDEQDASKTLPKTDDKKQPPTKKEPPTKKPR
jgi:hypothetical protein